MAGVGNITPHQSKIGSEEPIFASFSPGRSLWGAAAPEKNTTGRNLFWVPPGEFHFSSQILIWLAFSYSFK